MEPMAVFVARAVFDAVLILFAVGEAAIRIYSAVNARGSTNREVPSLFVLVVAFAIAIAGGLVVASRLRATAIPFLRWEFYGVGVAIMVLGIALRWWAVIVLGRSFTVEVRVRDDQQVVDRGPYRWVRHPSYTGLLMVFLGFGLALGNWVSLILAVVPPVIGIVYRIRVEEKALFAGLGEPYRRYAQGRSRLIPHVW